MGLQLDYLVKGMSKVLKYIDEKKSNSQMVSYKQDETDESYDYAFPVKSIDELKKIEILLRNNKKQYDAAVSADKSPILLFLPWGGDETSSIPIVDVTYNVTYTSSSGESTCK